MGGPVSDARFDALPMPTKVLAAGIALMCGIAYDRQTGQYVFFIGTLRGVLNML